MASPNEIMKNWPHYRCAIQKKEGEEVQIRTVRCRNIMELNDFLKRLYTVESLDVLNFMEIHELLPQGRIALVHESKKPWPKGVQEKKCDGIFVPKVPKSDNEERDKKIDEVVNELAGTATTVVGGVSGPDEKGFPLFPYKMEVA